VRQKDIADVGKRGRWLFWETLIIVLGVLIAFAVNDYWSDRQDRELEIQYLKRLLTDIKGDEQWLIDYIERPLVRKFDALNAIAPVVRSKEPVPEDLETFLTNVTLGGIGGASPTAFVTATTFEDLKNTGNLRLIRDTKLRSKINNYYVLFESNHLRIKARTTGYFMFVHAILPAELRNNLTMEAMQKFGIDHALEKILSQEFLDLFNQEYNFAYFIQRLYTQYAQRSAELAAEVQAHIAQLEGS